MFYRISEIKMRVYFRPWTTPFIKIKNFSNENIPIDTSAVAVYFTEEGCDELLSEIAISWKNNKAEILKLSKNGLFGFLGFFSSEVILSGCIIPKNEKLNFIAGRAVIISSREKVNSVFMGRVSLRDPNEPQPKRHSSD